MTVYQEEILARARRRFGSSNRPFPDSLPRLRSLLNLEERRLQVDHYSGLGGLEVANRRADLVDLLLDHLRGNAAARLPETEAGLLASSLAIVAVGGYGRRELSPLSDIDLAFLTPDALRETPVWLEQTIVEIVRVLFDLHLHVGAHGTFTLAEAVDLANQDLRTKTSFLESRLVAGNPQLFHQFQAQFWQACVLGRENEFLEWRQRDQTDRHNKSDNTPFLQEPHVKNGCGGLRDYQNLLWVAGVQAGARSTKDLFAQRLLADTEHRQLDRAYEFLLRVRNQMHYLQKRKGIGDILSLETQGDVAARLGYRQADPLRRSEAFMKDYYSHARTIYLLSETLCERLNSRALPAANPASPAPLSSQPQPLAIDGEIFDGFFACNGQISPCASDVFLENPIRLLRVFLHAQQRCLSLSPRLRQMIRERLASVDWNFRYNKQTRELFLSLLSSPGKTARVLRLMHEVDFLGRYLPEFGGLTCLVQHDFHQRFTADEHTLIALEHLDRLFDSSAENDAPCVRLLRQTPQPHILRLALLLHESGRAANAKPYSEASAFFASKAARRLQLSHSDRALLVFLIDHQQSLAHIAQNRNLEAPATIQAFAAMMKTQSNLDALMLFTVADSRARGEAGWSDWKQALAWQLYDRTAHCLSGKSQLRDASALRDSFRQQLLECQGGAWSEEIEAHLESMPDRYFEAHAPSEAAAHLRLFRRFFERLHAADHDNAALMPAAHWISHPERGHTELILCGWDRDTFLARAAGALALADLNILSVEIHPRADNLVLALFKISGLHQDPLLSPRAIKRADEAVCGAFAIPPLDTEDSLLKKKAQNKTRLPQLLDFPTRIVVTNDSHPDYTLVEIQAPDRLGLLYDILRTMQSSGLRVALAHITTEQGAAIDSFYVTNLEGQRITGKRAILNLQQLLQQTLSPSPPCLPGTSPG